MGALLAKKLFDQQPLQEKVDISILYSLIHYYQRHQGQRVPSLKPPESCSYEKQYVEVYSFITAQLVACLTEIHKQVQHDVDKLSLPFSLSVKKSSIDHPAAGNGVFLDGDVVPGSILMFHPGLVYLPKDVRKMPNYPNVNQDNDYLMLRYDGSVLDAKCFDISIVLPTGKRIPHPLAIGHMVNHPPPGIKPNIMPFNYDFMESFPSQLMYLVPNRYFRVPGILYKTSAVMRTILFVATEHIENKELFVNYRLNPSNELPDWYTPVDTKEDKGRWNS